MSLPRALRNLMPFLKSMQGVNFCWFKASKKIEEFLTSDTEFQVEEM